MAGEKVKLKNRQIVELFNGIEVINKGRTKQAKDGNGKDCGIVTEPYDITGKARYAINRTKFLIHGAAAAFSDVISTLRAKAQDGLPSGKDACPKCGGDVSNTERADEMAKRQVALNAEVKAVSEEEVEIEVFMCPIEEFKIESNKLDDFAGLMPMLKGEIS